MVRAHPFSWRNPCPEAGRTSTGIRTQETFVVLKGEIEFIANDECQMVSAGSIAIVPGQHMARISESLERASANG